jgi:site-specific recombinase XerD
MLIAEGLSLPIVGSMLGHSSPSMTARYAHLSDYVQRRAAEIVGQIVGGKRAK